MKQITQRMTRNYNLWPTWMNSTWIDKWIVTERTEWFSDNFPENSLTGNPIGEISCFFYSRNVLRREPFPAEMNIMAVLSFQLKTPFFFEGLETLLNLSNEYFPPIGFNHEAFSSAGRMLHPRWIPQRVLSTDFLPTFQEREKCGCSLWAHLTSE